MQWRRTLRLVACLPLALILGVAAYGGLVEAGLVRAQGAAVVGGDLALAHSVRPGLRVLFVGNSFTAANALPALVHGLAETDPGAGPIFAVSYTAGGSTLRRASGERRLQELLDDVRWDAVVLQEQSQLPSFAPDRRRRETDPFAKELHARIAAGGARTILFLTWGYRNGDRANVPGDSFAAMQARLNRGYAELASALPASVAPVGPAWAEALRRDPALALWSEDGRHPSLEGSYLAACVFYALLSPGRPAASAFTAGLGRAEARSLQRIARDVVVARR